MRKLHKSNKVKQSRTLISIITLILLLIVIRGLNNSDTDNSLLIALAVLFWLGLMGYTWRDLSEAKPIIEKPKVNKPINADVKLLKEYKMIDPMLCNILDIADASGVYIICLKPKCNLPKSNFKIITREFMGYKVVYVGKASKSLRNRDYKQHFNGWSGSSTFRRTIGVLLNLRLVPRSDSLNEKKNKVVKADEAIITNWMKNNLVMFFLTTSEYDKKELELINAYQPPLNLTGTRSLDNVQFRAYLKSMRRFQIT